MEAEEEIKKLAKSKKLIIGSERAIKLLKNKKAEKIFISSNCPDGVKKDIKKYCSLSGANCIELRQTNEELGMLCKRPFQASVIAVVKG
ncbi:MAG: ribosomal L7Ae/L30e/S12e/Gadd45 family protein [Candidatus Woesearchaeota archaeon]|nr:ribosomal L7Ae/L30e/S12e/Gadd45 family protein [Candidatus Woesearchaeota archaeon]